MSEKNGEEDVSNSKEEEPNAPASEGQEADVLASSDPESGVPASNKDAAKKEADKSESKTSEKSVLSPITSPNHVTNPDRPAASSEAEANLDDPTMPSLQNVNCPKSTMKALAEPHFNVCRLDRDGMLDHLEYMYYDLGISEAWNLPRSTLRMFLINVRERYQDNPYHNFKHCFCVAQMTYSIVCKLELRDRLSCDDVGALITAAICHDLDHPGVNNSYHNNSRSSLAILYDYESVLEQHHFAVACRILAQKQCNIFRNVTNRDVILHKIGELIVATDLAKHKQLLETNAINFDVGFDYNSQEHVMSMMKIVIKCADISNEIRPEKIATQWVDRLFAEYALQFDREGRERLPQTTYMDPDKTNIPEAQIGFIRGVLMPMYNELCRINEKASEVYITPLEEALTRYEGEKK